MPVNPVFERVFRKLYGKPCWGVTNWYGSGIHFEFGKPHLEIREPRGLQTRRCLAECASILQSV